MPLSFLKCYQHQVAFILPNVATAAIFPPRPDRVQLGDLFRRQACFAFIRDYSAHTVDSSANGLADILPSKHNSWIPAYPRGCQNNAPPLMAFAPLAFLVAILRHINLFLPHDLLLGNLDFLISLLLVGESCSKPFSGSGHIRHQRIQIFVLFGVDCHTFSLIGCRKHSIPYAMPVSVVACYLLTQLCHPCTPFFCDNLHVALSTTFCDPQDIPAALLFDFISLFHTHLFVLVYLNALN